MWGISKSFGGVKAIRYVHFEVHPSEIYARMGENGAEKSTLMKVLAEAISRDSGDILIDGNGVAYFYTCGRRQAGNFGDLSEIHACSVPYCGRKQLY